MRLAAVGAKGAIVLYLKLFFFLVLAVCHDIICYKYSTKKTMRKIIRVRKENIDQILAEIPGGEVVAAPLYENPVWSDDEPSLIEPVGMVGLHLPEGMSGKQAHKIIESVKSGQKNSE